MTEENKECPDATLPLYQCHKKVRALEIREIQYHPTPGVVLALHNPDGEFHSFRTVSDGYFERHNPQIGGYWVLYEDGYESFSPAEAFEGGYTLIWSSADTL